MSKEFFCPVEVGPDLKMKAWDSVVFPILASWSELTVHNDTLPSPALPTFFRIPVELNVLSALWQLGIHLLSCLLESDSISLRPPDKTCVDLSVINLHLIEPRFFISN